MKEIKGDDDLIKEWPFAYVVAKRYSSQYCHFCLKCLAKNLRCSKCHFAYYCDAQCQKDAWEDHREECAGLLRVQPRIPTDSGRLMARIIFRLKRSGPDEYVDVKGVCSDMVPRRKFTDLMTHEEDIKNDPVKTDHFASLCFILKDYIGLNELPSPTDLLQTFGRVQINCFSICQLDGSIGVGLYLNLSAFDHSCDPEALVIFDGPTAILRSLKPISSADQLMKTRICYLENLQTTKDRQAHLLEQYFFKCDCSRCLDRKTDAFMYSLCCENTTCSGAAIESEPDVYSCVVCGAKLSAEKVNEGLMVMDSSKWQLETVKKLDKERDSVYSSHITMNRCKAILEEQKGVLHHLNIHHIDTLTLAHDACVELEEWQSGLQYGIEVLQGYRKYYSSTHPALGIHLMKCGKLALFLERLDEAARFLEEADRILRVSHGEHHALYHQLKQLLTNCIEERRIKGTQIVQD